MGGSPPRWRRARARLPLKARRLGRPVQTLRMALDPLAFVEPLLSRNQDRQALQLPQADGVMLGAVGRLVESKGFEMLIEAFAKASARQPGLQLAIIGEGPQHALLQQRINALGLAGRVHLRGHREVVAGAGRRHG